MKIIFCLAMLSYSYFLNGQNVGQPIGDIDSPCKSETQEELLIPIDPKIPNRDRDKGLRFYLDPVDRYEYYGSSLSLYENGMYYIGLGFYKLTDVILGMPLGDGVWQESNDGIIELTDRSTGTRMKAVNKADTLLQFVSGIDFLTCGPFRWTWPGWDMNPWRETQRGLHPDTVRNRRAAYQRKPLVEAGNLVGSYGDPTEDFSLYLELNNMHKYRLYISSRSVLLSSGTWWRDKNLLILTDSSMKQNFYGLIGGNGIQSMVFPGGNRGQYLLKRN